MRLIDSHCHFDEFLRNGELADVLSHAKDSGIVHFVAIGTSGNDWDLNQNLAKDCNNLDYTVGVHPTCISKDCSLNLEPFFLSNTPPVAIGEIGLDYHYLPKDELANDTIDMQKIVFKEQLNIAKKLNVPVALHSREAFDDTFEIISNSGIDGDKVLFHCFGYSKREMALINEFGAYVSFSGNITYKSAGTLREALGIVDKNKLLIETDAPYLAPVPHRGQKNEPAFLSATAKFVSDFFKNKRILDLIFDNTVKFYNLNTNQF